MKYLKKYNESVDSKLLELQEFCNSYLAYLIDAGFSVKCNHPSHYDENENMINIQKLIAPNNGLIKRGSFSWNQIKDDFIPFYDVLSKKYSVSFTTTLLQTTFNISSDSDVSISYSDILEDKVNYIINNAIIKNILIKVKNK